MTLKIVPPDDWGNDWFGWAKSQTAHVFVGVFLVFALCMFGFEVFGGFPVKTHVFAVILAGYVAFKFIFQGWQRWDTIEDIVFVVGYGAAGPLSGSFEIEAGRSAIVMELGPLLPYFYVCTAHLIAGVLWRLR